MIKVLLADDNKLALKYLEGLVNWEEEGFEIVACAENGIEAAEYFMQYKPDIVITDILMPGMTGIELAREIKKADPNTVIIFISDYEEFEYVRSAMDMGVYDYILKHEDVKKKLYEKLNVAKKMKKHKNPATRFYEEGCLQSLFADSDSIKDNVLKEQAEEVFPGKYSFYFLEQDSYLPPVSAQLQLYVREVKEMHVKNACYLHFRQAVAMIKFDKYKYLLIVKNEENDTLPYRLKEIMREELFVSFSVLIVCENTDINEGMSICQRYKGMMEQKYLYPMSVVLNRSIIGETKYVDRDYFDLSKFKYNLLKYRVDDLCKQMDTAYTEAVRNRDIDALFQLIKVLLECLQPYHLKVMDYKKGGSFVLYGETSSEYWYSADDTIQWIKKKFMQLVQIWENNSFFSYSPQVQKAIKYIHYHYMKYDISAEEVAEEAGLSVNRLNTLMKEETGDTVWKLLTKVRVEKAKQLLDSGEYSISEIYPMVGYTTTSYFSRIFKKSSGVSPQKYRRMRNDLQKAEI